MMRVKLCTSCVKIDCDCRHAKKTVAVTDDRATSDAMLGPLLAWLRADTVELKITQYRCHCVVKMLDGKIGVGLGEFPAYALASAMEKIDVHPK